MSLGTPKDLEGGNNALVIGFQSRSILRLHNHYFWRHLEVSKIVLTQARFKHDFPVHWKETSKSRYFFDEKRLHGGTPNSSERSQCTSKMLTTIWIIRPNLPPKCLNKSPKSKAWYFSAPQFGTAYGQRGVDLSFFLWGWQWHNSCCFS